MPPHIHVYEPYRTCSPHIHTHAAVHAHAHAAVHVHAHAAVHVHAHAAVHAHAHAAAHVHAHAHARRLTRSLTPTNPPPSEDDDDNHVGRGSAPVDEPQVAYLHAWPHGPRVIAGADSVEGAVQVLDLGVAG